jgi:hypothetical protein
VSNAITAPRKVAFQIIVDETVNATVSFSTEIAADAGVQDIVEELSILREAAWAEIAASNRRKLMLHAARSEARLRKIEKAKADKMKLDPEEIAAEDALIATQLVALEAEVEAHEQVARELVRED